jgi:hypothetical protein
MSDQISFLAWIANMQLRQIVIDQIVGSEFGFESVREILYYEDEDLKNVCAVMNMGERARFLHAVEEERVLLRTNLLQSSQPVWKLVFLSSCLLHVRVLCLRQSPMKRLRSPHNPKPTTIRPYFI